MDILKFMEEVLRLKRTPRSGWAYYGIEEPESVAAHNFSVALLALILAEALRREGVPIDSGKVVKIVDFGAFVNFFGKRDGLVHVSQIENRRLNHPSDVLKEGQEVWVKLLGFDDRGKVRLAMKMVDQETGNEITKEEKSDN